MLVGKNVEIDAFGNGALFGGAGRFGDPVLDEHAGFVAGHLRFFGLCEATVVGSLKISRLGSRLFTLSKAPQHL